MKKHYVVTGPIGKKPTQALLLRSREAALNKAKGLAAVHDAKGLTVEGKVERGFTISDGTYIEVIPYHERNLYGIDG